MPLLVQGKESYGTGATRPYHPYDWALTLLTDRNEQQNRRCFGLYSLKGLPKVVSNCLLTYLPTYSPIGALAPRSWRWRQPLPQVYRPNHRAALLSFSSSCSPRPIPGGFKCPTCDLCGHLFTKLEQSYVGTNRTSNRTYATHVMRHPTHTSYKA